MTENVQQNIASQEATPTRMIGSSRMGLTIVLMMGMSVYYAMRVDMSVAILCMVNHTAISEIQPKTTAYKEVEVSNPKCIRYAAPVDGESSEDGPFVWDNVIQNQILGAFFFGYLALQIPGGWLAGAIGGRWVVLLCMGALSGLTILLPLVANNWAAVFAIRALQGVVSGAVCPAIQAMIAQWAPPIERSGISTVAYSGLQLGNVFAFPISGLLCRFYGWQAVFYVWGSLGFIWLVPWFFFGYNTPEEHPRIDPAEQLYITTAVAEESGGKQKSNKASINLCEIPWVEFLKSPPVWACLVGHYAGDWGAYFFLSQTPRYLKTVHLFDIASNSSMSALPYSGYFICIIISGPLSDVLQRTRLGKLWTRRIFAILGYVLPAALLILLGYLPCEYWQFALVVLIFIVGLSGLQYATWALSYFDIAPKYSGLLFGISNTIGCTTGIVSNAIAGVVMSPNPTLAEWRLLFFIASGVTAVGCFVYCFFLRADVQYWAIGDVKKDSRKEKDVVIPLRVTHLL